MKKQNDKIVKKTGEKTGEKNMAIYTNKCVGGKREDLGGLYVRSRWEANMARILNQWKAEAIIKNWYYEKERFYFEGIRRGTNSYLPDFEIEDTDGTIWYIEVKGYFSPQGKTALKRMAKFYPQHRILLVDKDSYGSLTTEYKHLIENWEE